jgi:hypothetical protein
LKAHSFFLTYDEVNEQKKKTQLQKYSPNPQNKTRGVSHYGLAIYIKKYLKAKEEL